MDEALAIRDYLPISVKNLNDGDYSAFLLGGARAIGLLIAAVKSDCYDSVLKYFN